MNETTKETFQNSQESPFAESQVQYQIEGKTFIVQPIFREDAVETVGGVLLRLMKAEVTNSFTHPQT